MWDSPKKMLAAGALLVLAGTRSPAQGPGAARQEKPLTVPAPTVQTLAITDSAPPSPGSAPSQERVEQLPAPTAARPAVPAPACPAAISGDGGEARGHAHPPVLAYRKEYEYPPLGAMMHEAFQIQVNNGFAARMVLYDYDFMGDRLNVRGSDRLQQIIQYWKACNYPLVIERTPYSPGLAQARQSTVINQLIQQGIAVHQGLVVIGAPAAIPLRGFEAQLIYGNLHDQTKMRGNIPIPGGTGAGTTGITLQP